MKKTLLATCVLLAGYMSFAQTKPSDSKWAVRLRAIAAVPPASSYDLTGTDVTISAAVVPELDFTYYFTKNLSAELILGTTKHKVKTDDNHGTKTTLGTVWLLPPTLNLQYHFPLKAFTPYVGAGVNYSIFYGAKDEATKLAYKNNIGFSTQIGTDIAVTDKWFINIDIKKIFLKTDVTVANTTTLKDVKVDPFIFGIGVGTRF